MPDMNRRQFLRAATGVGAVGLLAGAVTISIDDLLQAAHDRPLPHGAGTLVIVTLYGGNDGINTVIPYADSAYHDARPELAYAPGEVLQLDSALGLNPALTGFQSLWKTNDLAIIRGVSYPQPDHSHFRSMDIWQTASPSEPVNTGWIGRWLDATGKDPVRALNIGSVLPPLAVGSTATAATLSADGSSVVPQQLVSALAVADPADAPAMAQVRESFRDALQANSTFHSATSGHSAAAGASRATHTGKNSNALAAQLDVVAACIKARVPTRVYSVQLGGFDTHSAERDTQQRLLGVLDKAVTDFLGQMAGDPHGKDTVVMAYSEFGRRVRANASEGTDHGTAGPMFVAGVPVRGGFYGAEPSLTDLDNGDLKPTMDFRDVYFELLEKVVGTDPAPAVGPGRTSPGFIAA